MNFSSFFTIAFLGILLYQLIIGITQYILNKNKENIFFIFYIFCLLINFLFNFYFWLNPTPTNFYLLFAKSFFGLPVNFLIQMIFLQFSIYYLQLNTQQKIIFHKLLLINAFIFITTVVYSFFYPNWSDIINIIVNFLNIFLFIIPLQIVYKINNNNSKFLFKGTLALGISFIITLILFLVNSTLFNPDIVTMLGVIIEIVYFNYGLQFKIKTQETNLLLAKLEKQKAIEEEHKRVSADLHDEVGSTLSSIQIMSVLTQAKISETNADAKQLINTILEQSKKMQLNLSDIVWGLRTDLNSVNDLLIKIQEILKHTLEILNIDYEIKIDENIFNLKLSVLQRSTIVLIVKEAINNIIKYAQASKVIIHLIKSENCLLLSVTDNGNGFKANQKSYGNGLINMENRSHKINGTFQIVSQVQNGTCITINFPILLN